ncbi:uncharacterized protein ZBAI_07297 [Zygosaccharomyces bailii ISA1307]|nr:uncharacterized protein ZBAI_07297 [Zygosaccharomyces bailii ISA1307]
MDVSLDYEESSNDSSHEQDDIPLPKPVFLRPPKRRQRVSKPQNKHLDKNQARHIKEATTKEKSASCSWRPLIFKQMTSEIKRLPRVTTAKDPSSSMNGSMYEFGDPVNGYRFITTAENFSIWKAKSSQKENRLPAAIELEHVREYWSEPRGNQLPVDPGNEISKEALQKFYDRSCKELNIGMKTLMKAERIRWHPDKSSLREATQVFQIINDLWESL